ncbi:hypothetical protein G3480_00415 [Thiorhodococcus mannitoliphagus]|uniref:Uncharacterized protein n=1 Tax=Thiorhodococcus mannitoliphagus TaxID=329406 RepID=A0A6P1DLA3_9GAMM|nr:hypothetical protein [Thiorhodococcus mannitoliphagus]NEX18798.1 hypothetical protein [Thiorhodococcus mannitoliphagus]
MSAKERDFLRSEVATLEGLLSSVSEDRLIERIGIEERLEQARARLAKIEAEPLGKPLPIIFRGAPVEGSQSIDAGFASTALGAFIEATDTVAASLTDELKALGRLPRGNQRSLRIVDTARGSFGFELELSPPPADDQISLSFEDESDPYERAIGTTFALIKDAAESDEEGISDLIAEIHPRAAAKIQAFAKVLFEGGAGFAAEFEGARVRLNEGRDVQRVLDALKDEDISEREEQLRGVVLGILPESRRFECRLADGVLIAGKVDRALSSISSFKARWENKEALLSFRVISVRTNRRFVLKAAEEVVS